MRQNNKEISWDAIVIGSGIGGLVTATQLASKGAQVLVLERYMIPGGSSGAFHRNGYTFDVGASMIFGFGEKGYTNLLTRALSAIGEKCETIPDPVQLAYHLPGGAEVSVSRNYDQFISSLTSLFPHEEKGIKAFYKVCWEVFNCLDSMPLLSIEDPAYLAKVFFKAPLSCLGLARWLPFNVGEVARRHIKDQQLLRFIDIECFCWSVMPADKTPMINAGMVFSDRHAGGINYPKGGVGVISEKLVKGLEKNGGKVLYKSRVVKIILEGNKAIGVKLANGEQIYARTIISNATRWDTFGGEDVKEPLIEQSKTPSAELKWRNRYQTSPSFLSIHLGVKKDCIPNDSHCHHLILEEWDQMEKEQGVAFISIPTLLDQSLAPKDHHIIHAFTPSSIIEWKSLTPSEYVAKKELDCERLLSKIEKVFPNLKPSITHKEIGTPKSHRRFLGRHKGSYGPIPAMRLPGLLPMPFNSTAIKGLFLVGDSCFPGQGLNAVAFSGFACAHKIGAELGINPWSLPE
ncbi:Carotenoid cis-trans isomerase [Prochlorococcus sp. SS52]|nr:MULTISPECIES: carotenoid isomerase [Prochlorococcus]KGG11101.1 Carotenoid cis-trans isomerase [Prochlorococcus marinus str. LG]KGG21439.1 Carotenoid cis-trans isomerase [Prochlorococcus marinus str. SS2]KGG23216.1 Carotenoid cis-trans isomerase [Prochlorococcus marinus str. SS35]KGG33927.1 Carotenoid cis-trans isomerase [Prochlorococcus marinus str. SS51]KGG36724.1 Carotenoid cis-trans isomerase [Prochlorococcus sp. SS52]